MFDFRVQAFDKGSAEIAQHLLNYFFDRRPVFSRIFEAFFPQRQVSDLVGRDPAHFPADRISFRKCRADHLNGGCRTFNKVCHFFLSEPQKGTQNSKAVAQLSLDWLMRNDLTAPIVNREGEPYTKEAFELIRAHDFADPDRIFPEYFSADKIAGLCVAMLLRTLLIGVYRRIPGALRCDLRCR